MVLPYCLILGQIWLPSIGQYSHLSFQDFIMYTFLYLGLLDTAVTTKVCPYRIDTWFLLIMPKDISFRKLSWKKLLFIIRPNKIGGPQLENVFHLVKFIQFALILTENDNKSGLGKYS